MPQSLERRSGREPVEETKTISSRMESEQKKKSLKSTPQHPKEEPGRRERRSERELVEGREEARPNAVADPDVRASGTGAARW